MGKSCSLMPAYPPINFWHFFLLTSTTPFQEVRWSFDVFYPQSYQHSLDLKIDLPMVVRKISK